MLKIEIFDEECEERLDNLFDEESVEHVEVPIPEGALTFSNQICKKTAFRDKILAGSCNIFLSVQGCHIYCNACIIVGEGNTVYGRDNIIFGLKNKFANTSRDFNVVYRKKDSIELKKLLDKGEQDFFDIYQDLKYDKAYFFLTKKHEQSDSSEQPQKKIRGRKRDVRDGIEQPMD